MKKRKKIVAQFCGGYVLEDGTVVVDEYTEAADDEGTTDEQPTKGSDEPAEDCAGDKSGLKD